MRILVVTSYYKPAYVYGGPVHSISAMCEALVTLGADVTVFTTNANGRSRLAVPLGHPVSLAGVEVYYNPIVPLPPKSSYFSPALIRTCRQNIKQFDIVSLELMFSYSLGPAIDACRQAGVPYIISPRGQFLPWSLRQKWLKKKIYFALVGKSYLNSAAALHCTDPSEAETVGQLGLKVPTFVVPNGINSDRFANLPPRGKLRQQQGIPLEAKVLLFLGRLHPKKRPDIAVETLAATLPRAEPAHLIIAGPDESQLATTLRVQAQKLRCSDQLHITGLLKGEDTLSALSDADLFLMPSAPQSENFGMSAVEAMAAGLPILVSEGVPVGYWAEAAGAGQVVHCTATAFSKATVELLNKPEQLKLMGQRGQELVRQKFDITVVAKQMLAQYEAIIKKGRPLQC